MQRKELEKLPLGSLKPLGYLKRQLFLQAEGLSGNIEKLFKDVSKNSSWLGGRGEAWERGPYYIDGLIPLAYLLKDSELIKTSQKWIDAILSSGRKDGSYGPKLNPDYWPRMVVNKMLTEYYEATSDERVIPFLLSYYRFMLKNIENKPFYNWAEARALEEYVTIYWLYDKTKEEFLIDLAEKIKNQSIDWTAEFKNFKYVKPSKDYMGRLNFTITKALFYGVDFLTAKNQARMQTKGEILWRNTRHFNRFYHLTHGVDLAMAVKYPTLRAYFRDETDNLEASKGAYETLLKSHGTATGMFTADEHLSGPSPTQGSELCSVVELMFSFEKLFELTGDFYYAEALEKIAFNALPATFTPDMCAHQYVQQVNQVEVSQRMRNFYDSYANANIYGLKPNYACCLANMHQGFPKFAEHLSFKKGESLLIAIPAPQKITTVLNNEKVDIEISGDYPYDNKATLKVISGNPEIEIRIPKNSESVLIDGVLYKGESATFKAICGKEYSINFALNFRFEINPDKSLSAYYGNVLLALEVEEFIKVKKGVPPFCDYEMLPLSNEWNFAIQLSKGTLPHGEVEIEKMSDMPFMEPSLSVLVRASEVKNWKLKNGEAEPIPKTLLLGDDVEIPLVPYAMTNLRIAQFPYIDNVNPFTVPHTEDSENFTEPKKRIKKNKEEKRV